MTLTTIGKLNRYLLQFLFLRVSKVYGTSSFGHRIMGYKLMFPVLPFTGWYSDFIPRHPWSVWIKRMS